MRIYFWVVVAGLVGCGDNGSSEISAGADGPSRFKQLAGGSQFSQHLSVEPYCGDGVVVVGEECDDGNESNSDRCVADCKVARCGDGFVETGIEECDDGNADDTDGCRSDCKIPRCGDGHLDSGEQCDDGNGNDHDACTSACVTAVCGDGIVDTGFEQCDDGNTVDTDGCRNDCTMPSCGDGIVDAGEQCDDANHVDTDACRNNCTIPICGDGIVDANEQCDDGNPDNTDACLTSCVIATCGDGYVETGTEQCDDGNHSDTDGCSTTCAVATCGDGNVEVGVEQCDDGAANGTSGDPCAANCQSAQVCDSAYAGEPDPSPGVFNNPSFEFGYDGWSFDESVGNDVAVWALGTTGSPLQNGSAFDYSSQTCRGIDGFLDGPVSVAATSGSAFASFSVQGPGAHTLYQDITLPAFADTISWSMGYENMALGWTAGDQEILIELRDPSDDSLIRTLYDTTSASSDQLDMSTFTASVSGLGGQTVRLEVHFIIYTFYLNVQLDSFAVYED